MQLINLFKRRHLEFFQKDAFIKTAGSVQQFPAEGVLALKMDVSGEGNANRGNINQFRYSLSAFV